MLVDEVTNVPAMMPAVAEFARKHGIAALTPDDGTSDQVIVVSGVNMLMTGTKIDIPTPSGFCVAHVIVVSGVNMMMTGTKIDMTTYVFGEESADIYPSTGYHGEETLTFKSTKVGLDMVCEPVFAVRKTKIVCTMGPACWSEETIGKLMDAGMNIARFNFSHGDHKGHGEVLERFRKVAAEKKSDTAVLMDTKGPEIRTAMLRDHKNIILEKDQDIVIEAVGDDYTKFEGYKTDEETRIGLSYGKLCQSVKVGNQILIADGTIVIEVKEILSETTLKGKVLNTKDLGERKNCNLPGVVVDIPVLTPHDINDVQNFCAKHKMDFIAASFVQTGEDVRFIRKTLDEAGGQDAGLKNIDDIIRETDGIMVARGDLGDPQR
ncbi:pyruvate kinase [Baffinella frigidus]|nr:pyruvate kinase [Cryptophyta sp. CCMP2293]